MTGVYPSRDTRGIMAYLASLSIESRTPPRQPSSSENSDLAAGWLWALAIDAPQQTAKTNSAEEKTVSVRYFIIIAVAKRHGGTV
jgi:hypothetical protein